MELDGIAITNHNMFDQAQYRTIANTLDIEVLPGIEINIGAGPGHILLIADKTDVADFSAKCDKVSELVKTAEDSIDVAKLREIFGDLSKYLLIPHYDKRPPVDKASLEQLGDDFIVGEVMSAKKFIYALKDDTCPTPLLLSDARVKTDWDFKTRQTYLNINTIDIRSMRLCLADKSKVSLSKEEGKQLIQVTPEGISVSSGLTVILGGRSSGKSHTLDEIAKYSDDVKYIKQFALIETDQAKAAEKFNEGLSRKQREDSDSYLKRFRGVIDDIKNISLKNDDRKVSEYVESLLKSASEVERQDLYSKAVLFSETPYQIVVSDRLTRLINATKELLNAGVYSDIVEANVPRANLTRLLLDLIEKARVEAMDIKKREWVNDLAGSIKHGLNSQSAVTAVKDVDLLEVATNKKKVEKFCSIAKELQKSRTIDQKKMQRFTIEERSVPIGGAQDLKDISGRRASFSAAYAEYDDPYKFLLALQEIDEVDSTSYYRFFTKIEYEILNEYGVSVSGGERAEFRLIHEIDGASKFEMLLIDEPESSFDNIFLSSDVNQKIKEIAKETPVVVVTHNNTVGASIKPDYLIYTEREIVEGSPVYKVFSGLATDKTLTELNGEAISNGDITLRYLEAGRDEYEERKKLYEMLKD